MNVLWITDNGALIQQAGWLGPWEITLIVVVVLLLFGGRKIPELMKGLGKGMKEFKEGIAGEDEKKAKSGEEKTADKNPG